MFGVCVIKDFMCIWLRSFDFLKVCLEEIMIEILVWYFWYNVYVVSYIWKYDGRNLDMDKMLEDNGILDEDEEFYKFSMNDDIFF